ncbi:DUF523 domain-containing protein [Desulfofundulus thermobenzoicus]|uniref:DUF523 domain-containing protein n=1 Tax=Desulfofundulus thermobenzoicus TaxID=29376 RepID=A0A6N7IW13_9FIRM|nr:DUF523 domain-containing protein [Desulfofundulus thermobenzoicus]MQL53783.1 DUF523 domain-containing protein [Desulfofundulus thermobenzoicus]
MEYLVSACLAGEACAYDGRARTCAAVEKLVREGRAVTVCPECLGGLAVPRPPVEITGGTGTDVLVGRGRAINCHGVDVTRAFLQGAREALRIAEKYGIRKAVLKARSPSCGYRWIHDGTFTGKLKQGHGVTAALLLKAGVEIFTEEEVHRLKL